ncbi:MAG: M23 family metallopeptidase [Novosphingobium sp.]|nr:M23 family metallopeptidase [Novosphingobium sp.]
MRRAGLALMLAAAMAGCVSNRAPPRSARAEAGPAYVVRPGDTLAAIAQRHGLMLSTLARANRIPPPYLIRVGQRLAIPPRPRATQAMVSRPVVQPLPRATPPPAYGRAPTYSPAPAPRLASAPRLVWPADGPVGERFGGGADPRGISITAHAGAAVRVAAAGTVLFAGDEPQRYGRLVLVDHGGGWVTAYGHLGRLVVSSGESVRANARLGFVGERNLHFELRRDNQPVDPLPQLPPRF